MEPLENVLEDAEGKGGGADAEEPTGFRTTIIRLSTCSSVNEPVAGTLGSTGGNPRLFTGGTAGAKSGTAAERGVCANGPSVVIPLVDVLVGAGTKGGGTPLAKGYELSSIA